MMFSFKYYKILVLHTIALQLSWQDIKHSLLTTKICVSSNRIIVNSFFVKQISIKVAHDRSRAFLRQCARVSWSQRYTYRVLQTIQMKLILLCVWAEPAVLGSTKTALKFKYEIQIGYHTYNSINGAGYKLEK